MITGRVSDSVHLDMQQARGCVWNRDWTEKLEENCQVEHCISPVERTRVTSSNHFNSLTVSKSKKEEKWNVNSRS